MGHQNWLFRFFRDSTASSASGIGFFGTVQHFEHLRNSGLQSAVLSPKNQSLEEGLALYGPPELFF